jgi:hypothetical protein
MSCHTILAEVEVTSRLTVSQSICLGVEPTLGLVTWYYFLSEGCCLKVAVLFPSDALCDKRTGLQLAVHSLNGLSHAELITIFYYLIWDSPILEGHVPVFWFPSNSQRQSHFTADSQYVSVSSPLCGCLTRYCFLFKSFGLESVVLSLWGALSYERPVCPL